MEDHIFGTTDRALRGMCTRSIGDDQSMTALGDVVEQVLRATEDALAELPDKPISSTPSSVRELLAAGEDVVAYETLCDNLHEIDTRPPADLCGGLRQAATDAGADPSRAQLPLG